MENLKLTNEGIDLICENVLTYLTDNGLDRKLARRNVLTIEEALLKFQEAFGQEKEITYRVAKILGQLRIVLFVSGEEFNPFEVDNADDVLMNSLLSSYDTALPSWKYKNQTNQVVFNVN